MSRAPPVLDELLLYPPAALLAPTCDAGRGHDAALARRIPRLLTRADRGCPSERPRVLVGNFPESMLKEKPRRRQRGSASPRVVSLAGVVAPVIRIPAI